jgi:hypothetical protein
MLNTNIKANIFFRVRFGGDTYYLPLRLAEGTTRPLLQPRRVSGLTAWRNIEWKKRGILSGDVKNRFRARKSRKGGYMRCVH